eukprot:9001327-Lingulodinium_polyedra.AAC.1
MEAWRRRGQVGQGVAERGHCLVAPLYGASRRGRARERAGGRGGWRRTSEQPPDRQRRDGG